MIEAKSKHAGGRRTVSVNSCQEPGGLEDEYRAGIIQSRAAPQRRPPPPEDHQTRSIPKKRNQFDANNNSPPPTTPSSTLTTPPPLPHPPSQGPGPGPGLGKKLGLQILNLHPPLLPVRLARNHLLPRLGNRPQHLVVVEAFRGDDGRGLGLEGYGVGFDACVPVQVWSALSMGGGGISPSSCLPSNLLSTRSTAPEHPPHDMATLNL